MSSTKWLQTCINQALDKFSVETSVKMGLGGFPIAISGTMRGHESLWLSSHVCASRNARYCHRIFEMACLSCWVCVRVFPSSVYSWAMTQHIRDGRTKVCSDFHVYFRDFQFIFFLQYSHLLVSATVEFTGVSQRVNLIPWCIHRPSRACHKHFVLSMPPT